jgi:glucokinase
VALVGEALRDTSTERASAVGVAVWGRVDATRGVVMRLGANADWDGYPLRSALAAALGVPVAVASATEAAALAEAAGANLAPGQRALYVSNGRTITSALVVDGAIEGVEGQLGHLRVRDDGPRCSCGLRGHLEPIASTQSIVRTMIGRASDSDESHAAMQRISGGRAEAMTAAQVVALAEQGDAIAASVVGEALDALAVALANAAALSAPQTIILGGRLVGAGDGFLSPLRERAVPLIAPFAQVPALRWGALEPFAALIGAARVAEMA